MNDALIIYSCFILHQEPFVPPFLPPRLSQGRNGASFPIPPWFLLGLDSLHVELPASWMLAIKPRVIGCIDGVCFFLTFLGSEEREGSSLSVCVRRDLDVFLEALRSWESTEAASVLAVWLMQIWDGCWTSWCLCRMETSVSQSNYWMNCWEMYCWRSCYPEDGPSWLWWSSDAPSSGQHSICPKPAELTRVAPFNQSNLIQYQTGPPRITNDPWDRETMQMK